ncbi:MAG: DUF3084 domain-containing protein [Cyanobacteria bacterium P01_G01_bin.38]
MDVGLILVATILLLGGVIATVGDRIGMRVGKARLSLFNLRPRQTATVVSVLTGGVISASTLGLLLITSEQLRKGLFEFEEIQSNLSEARQALEETETEKADVEVALKTVIQQKQEAESGLKQVISALDNQAGELRTEIDRLQEDRAALIERQQAISDQAEQLRTEIDRLQQERQGLLARQEMIRGQIAQRDQEITQRDQEIAQRDQEITQRDQEIVAREEALSSLETQQVFLAEEIGRLEAEFVKLRSGSVAVSRNETLALLITRPESASAATREIEQILAEANRLALRKIWPDAETEVQILRIAPAVVEQVVNQTLDGETYVVRVAASGNYIVGEPCVLAQGEPCVEVTLQTKVNRVIFQSGETIASVEVETAYPETEALVEKLQILLLSAQVQAQIEGIVIDEPRVAGGLTEPLVQFLENVQNYGSPLAIEALASQPIFTTGPLYLDLVATQNGQPIFRTNLE